MNEPSPTVLYEPVLLDPATENIVYQAGAFTTGDQAQEVLAVWRQEGRTEQMTVNLIPVYRSVEEWKADR